MASGGQIDHPALIAIMKKIKVLVEAEGEVEALCCFQ